MGDQIFIPSFLDPRSKLIMPLNFGTDRELRKKGSLAVALISCQHEAPQFIGVSRAYPRLYTTIFAKRLNSITAHLSTLGSIMLPSLPSVILHNAITLNTKMPYYILSCKLKKRRKPASYLITIMQFSGGNHGCPHHIPDERFFFQREKN